MPIVCIFTIIIVYNVTNETSLSPASTFAVLTLMNSLSAPLTALSHAAHTYKEFEHALDHVSHLLNDNQDRQQQLCFTDTKLEIGSIQLCSASFSISNHQAPEHQGEKHSSCEGKNKNPIDKSIGENIDSDENLLEINKVSQNLKNEDKSKKVISDLNVSIKSGEKYFITGSQGSSGKSLFLLSLIGETDYIHGDFKTNGKIIYASMKKPLWLEGQSILDNIIVGKKYDHQKFVKILNAVMLDISNLPGKFYFKIYHNASNIAMFDQKKILLARSLYQEGDIFLFENIFESFNEVEKKT